MSQNNSGIQEITWATQFSTIGGPVVDPRTWAYPQHCKWHNKLRKSRDDVYRIWECSTKYLV